LFVVGGILLIGAVIGGLVWYQVAAAKAREEERQRNISGNIAKARVAIQGIREATVKFDAEFSGFAAKATKKADDLTVELSRLLPDWKDSFKPAPTKELLDAIASTNKVQEAATPPPQAAATNAPPAAAATTNAPPATAAKGEPAKKEEAKEEPKAPEAQEAPKVQEPSAVADMRDLWEKAYSCSACQIRVSVSIAKVLAECDKADAIKEETEAAMKALGEISISAKDMYDQIQASPDVTNVKKNLGLIDSKGKKIVDMTVKRLRLEKIEADRKARKEAQEAAEKAAKEKAEEERKALVEKEVGEISEKFDAIAAQGCFRQLDWRSAMRQLDSAQDGFKTAEGQLAAKLQIRKVTAMKKVQEVFIAKLKGHTFKGKPKKGSLNGMKVVSISEKEIQFSTPKGKTSKMLWTQFYRDCPGNLNEAINTYIVNGKRNSGLGLKDWADAMAGAALTMKLVCSEVNGATERAEQLVKLIVETFPDFAKTAKEMFPDIAIATETEE